MLIFFCQGLMYNFYQMGILNIHFIFVFPIWSFTFIFLISEKEKAQWHTLQTGDGASRKLPLKLNQLSNSRSHRFDSSSIKGEFCLFIVFLHFYYLEDLAQIWILELWNFGTLESKGSDQGVSFSFRISMVIFQFFLVRDLYLAQSFLYNFFMMNYSYFFYFLLCSFILNRTFFSHFGSLISNF